MAKWSDCDNILVLDLYFKAKRRVLRTNDPDLVKISELVRKPEGSVRMKMQNYLYLDDPTRKGSLSNASQQSKLIWSRFANSEQRVKEAAADCRRKLPDNKR